MAKKKETNKATKKKDVNKVTKDKVEKAMKKLGFSPVMIVIIVVALAVIAQSAAFIVDKVYADESPKITRAFIDSKLETASELVSAKMIYNGLINYSNGKIPFITEDAFSMVYSAEVTAGIDISQVESEVTETQVVLKLPQVDVLSIAIDEDSIEFYDNNFALFKGDSKDDVAAALKQATVDVEKQEDLSQLKQTAKEQIETIMKNLFEGCIGDKELVIEYI